MRKNNIEQSGKKYKQQRHTNWLEKSLAGIYCHNEAPKQRADVQKCQDKNRGRKCEERHGARLITVHVTPVESYPHWSARQGPPLDISDGPF